MAVNRTRILLLLSCCLAAAGSACGGREPAGGEGSTAPAASVQTPAPAPVALPRTPSPPDASVAILSPRQGDIVSSPVRVVFGIEGMTVAPAGDSTPNSGHHHLLIDAPVPDLGLPIPTDDRHRHYGQGQTEAEIELAPGEHTLQLILADANHVPHDPPVMSAPITITVQ